MANPRELAQKAFTLLQDALRESESRATELDAELKKQRAPKNQLEERVDVLTHRIESLEAECQRWQREVSHLQEVLEQERVKIQQLKKKLEVAESGPDRLTKKEINFWRQRAEHFDAETREYKNRIARLKQELESRAELEPGFGFVGDGPGSADADSELVRALESAREETNSLRRQVEAQAAELETLQAGLAAAEERRPDTRGNAETEAVRRDAENLRSKLAGLEKALADSQRQHGEAQASANRINETVRERDTRLTELSAELEKTRAELTNHREREQALRADLEKTRNEIAERDRRFTALSTEIDQARAEVGKRDAEIKKLEGALHGRTGELEQHRGAQQRLQNELADLRKRNDATASQHLAQLESLSADLGRKDGEIARLQTKYNELEREHAAWQQEQREAREQISGLEAELKEEKECTANLSELANERREELTRLEDKVEEADERYAEAKWQLGKAQHFERLVRRRKGLISSLLAALRAKSKANSALKAGLDGLRTYKATAEANQHKLLVRLDKLNAELKESEETIAKHQGATMANEELQAAAERITGLEERINTQVDIIQTLENDLKAAKAMQQGRNDVAAELEEVRQELEAKSKIIERLEADADEQQRKFAKRSESETMRLRALEEKDKGLIDELQHEIERLREALAQQAESAEGNEGAAPDSELAGKLKERETSISRLVTTVKEKDAEIAKLKESSAQWKRKFEFLSKEAPSAYQSVAEK